MKYFSIAELSRSTKARERGIDNTPPSGVAIALTSLIERVLDPVREAWGRPITINSGYRLNTIYFTSNQITNNKWQKQNS